MKRTIIGVCLMKIKILNAVIVPVCERNIKYKKNLAMLKLIILCFEAHQVEFLE